jgi:O-antigen ligase
LYAILAVLVVTGATALVSGAEIAAKFQKYAAPSEVLNARDRIWRMGLAAWERHPWVGVGMSNYSRIDLASVARWRTEAGKAFDPGQYLGSDHAHSLYVTTLAERGVVGAAVLAAVLFVWLAWLLRLRPDAGDSDNDWILWGGALSGWFITVTVGLINTTLHHEHGILATLLLGLWLTNLPRQRHRVS